MRGRVYPRNAGFAPVDGRPMRAWTGVRSELSRINLEWSSYACVEGRFTAVVKIERLKVALCVHKEALKADMLRHGFSVALCVHRGAVAASRTYRA